MKVCRKWIGGKPDSSEVTGPQRLSAQNPAGGGVMEADMQQDLIGREVWDCVGCALTPRMRQDILLAAADMYDWWEAGGKSFRWDREGGGWVETEPNPVATMGDLFSELTEEQQPCFPSDLLAYSEKFYEWFKDYLHESWGAAAYEKEDEGDSQPMRQAKQQVFAWLSGLQIEDVLAMRSADKRVADWRTVGF